MKIEDAKDTTVFVVESMEVAKVNLYDHIMVSQELTTSPKGVAPKMFVEEVMVEFFKDEVMDKYSESFNPLSADDFDSEKEFEKYVLDEYVKELNIEAQYHKMTLEDFNRSRDYYELTYYCISEWRIHGSRYVDGSKYWDMCYKTEQEANQALFDTVYQYSFSQDCSRDVQYFETEEEALDYIKETA